MAPKPVAQLTPSDEEVNENIIASEAANVTPEVVASVSAAIADETFEDAQSVIDADNDATESAMEYAHEAAESVEELQRFVEVENMESPFAPDDLERAIQAFAQDVVTADEAPTALSVPANTTEAAADKATKETPIAHEDESAAPVSTTTTSQASISAAEAEEASETSSCNLPPISFDEIVFSTEHDEHLGEYSATTDTDPAARQHKQNRRRRRPNVQKTSSEVRKELEEGKPTAAGGKKDGEDGRKPRPHRPRRRRPNDKGSKSATE